MIEVKKHNQDLISLKDVDGMVNLSDDKWAILLERLSNISESIYFKGVRENYVDEDINRLSRSFGDNNLNSNKLLKLPNSIFMFSRNGISQIWEHYQHTFIFFLIEGNIDFLESQEADWYLSDYMDKIKGFVLYKGIEEDVLWLRKNGNLNFQSIGVNLNF